MMRALEGRQTVVRKREEELFIEVSIGNPKQKVLLKLSLLFKGIYLTSNANGFNKTLSSTFRWTTTHSNSFGSGMIASDAIEIPAFNFISNAFPFFFIFEPIFIKADSAGLLGIAYNEEDYSDANLQCFFDFFDYVDSYQRRYNIIGLKSISKDKAVLSFGELPSEVKQKTKLYRTCPITSRSGEHSWRCSLNALYFDEGSFFSVNANVDFVIGGNAIGVTQEVFWFICNKYFNRHANCVVKRKHYQFITCDKQFNPKDIGVISFILGKWTLKVKMEHLFIESNEELMFAVMSEEPFTNWFIAPSLLLNQFIFLDGPHKKIGFYHSSELQF